MLGYHLYLGDIHFQILSILLGHPDIVSIVTCCRLDVLGLNPRMDQCFFSSPKAFRLALVSTQPSIQSVLVSFPGAEVVNT
jgi:hypothetical protein